MTHAAKLMKVVALGLAAACLLVPDRLTHGADLPGYPHREVLPNGLRITCCPFRGLPKVAFKLSFDLSGRDDLAGMDGMHVLAFHSVVATHWASWVHRVEVLGGWWDPINIYPEVHAQDVVLPSESWEEGVCILKEILETAIDPAASATPAFQECRQYHEKHLPSGTRGDLLDREGFSEPFAGNSLTGSREGLQRATDADVLTFRRRHCVPGRAQVTVVGDVDMAAVLARLRRDLGPLANPKDAVLSPALLKDFKPGWKVLMAKDCGGDGDVCVRMAYPIPSSVTAGEAVLMADLLKARMDGISSADVRADLRPGQRLLRIRADGPSALEVLAAVDERLRGFPESVGRVQVRAGLSHMHGKLLKRLSSPYWMSWPLAFTYEPLGWRGDHPVLAFRALEATDETRARRVLLETLDPARRLVVLMAGNREEEAQLRSAAPPVMAPASLQEGPEEALPPPRTLRDSPPPRVTVSANGALVCWEDPLLVHYRIECSCPMDAMVKGRKAYAASLKASRGNRPVEVELKAEAIRVVWRQPCSTEAEVLAGLREIEAWLAVTPGAPRGAGGEGPSWTCFVVGPGPIRAEPKLRSQPVAEVDPVGMVDPEPGHEVLCLSLGRLASPEDRVRGRLLQVWLDPMMRKERRYGPFTLTLPPVHEGIESVVRFKQGDEACLALRIRGDASRIVAWLKDGGGVSSATPKDFVNLQGWLRTELFWEDSGTPFQALQARREEGMESTWRAIDGADFSAWSAWATRSLSGVKQP